LSDLDLRKKYQIQVIGIQDTVEHVISMVVSPSQPIKATDRLIVLGKQEHLKKIKGLNGP
jgi:Trk K+ transport system NAD-binding subunit